MMPPVTVGVHLRQVHSALLLCYWTGDDGSSMFSSISGNSTVSGVHAAVYALSIRFQEVFPQGLSLGHMFYTRKLANA